MSNFYLIRNLLSLKAAKSIDEQYSYENSIFSVIDTNSQLKNVILKNIDEKNTHIESTLKLPILKVGVHFLKQRYQINNNKALVEKLLLKNSVTQLFLTYPIHFDSYVYYVAAKKLKIAISFYEEGPCFYRKGLTEQYDVKNFKDWVKKSYFQLCGLKMGYAFNADNWYCSLPIKEEYKKIRLKYERVNLPQNMKFLFLSRPISDDYPNIKINDEIKAIKKFYKLICREDILYMKFHPRENNTRKLLILEALTNSEVKVQPIESNDSSEDIVFSMGGGAICGYDTTTLVYAKNINTKINVYSVLNVISDIEPSGFLDECVQEYKLKYSHIDMIK